MDSRITFAAIAALITILMTPLVSAEEHPWASDDFRKTWEDRDDWRAVSPGELARDASQLVDLRVTYLRETNLLSETPNAVKALYQFEKMTWKGKPALYTLWSSSGDPKTGASAQIMSHISDFETGQVILQMNAFDSGPSALYFNDGKVVGADMSTDDTPSIHDVESSPEAFNLLALGHITSLMNLKAGMEFVLPWYDYATSTVVPNAYRVSGRRTIQDVHGDDLNVWDVQGFAREDGWLNHYYVSDEAPYFVGYDLSNTILDKQLSRVRLDNHVRIN